MAFAKVYSPPASKRSRAQNPCRGAHSDARAGAFMENRMFREHTLQVADRAADGAAVAAWVLWLADAETAAIIFSAVAAGCYYLIRALVLWRNRDQGDDE